MNEEIIIPAIVFGSIVGVIYMYLTTRNKERMALIEKGESADLFLSKSSASLFKDFGLKLGVMAIGVAIGILLGYLLSSSTQLQQKVAYPSMIFLFAGISLVCTHYLTNKKV